MVEHGLDIEKMILLRKDIHQNAEIAFKEVETSRKIQEALISYGVEESNIKKVAITGLVVDIVGKGEPD